ncbi:MAG: glycosyltransferase family 4 protein, partial [candidate division WOR-3 bacterium]
KINVIYNGVDPHIIQNNSMEAEKILESRIGIKLSGRFVIGMVANFSPQKDHETVIKAVSLLAKKFPELVVVFVGSEKIAEGTGCLERLKSYVSENDLGNYIYFVGEMSNVYAVIPRFDIGLLISNFEGFGNALVEYAMAGKPIIGTAVGGIKEIINDNENGFLINPGDYEELARKIELLLTDSKLRNKMGQISKKVALEKFSVNTWVDNVCALYERIL